MNAQYISERVEWHLKRTHNFWVYPSDRPNEKIPHVVLSTNKRHSGVYVNVGGMLEKYPEIRKAIIANDIVRSLRNVWTGKVDRVVGSAKSATDLAKDVADIMEARHIRMIKVDDEYDKKQFWSYINEPLVDGDVICQIEDVVTTGKSSRQVREGIIRANPKVKVEFVSALPSVVLRSKTTEVEEFKVIPLLWIPTEDYDPAVCPYCAVGSVAISDVKKNWVELVKTSTPSAELGGVKWR